METTYAGLISPAKVKVSTLSPGDTVINGEGNICMVLRPTDEDRAASRVRLANLNHGGHYTVKETCEHTRVHATVTWRY